MGLEIGWYLRFSRQESFQAMIQPSAMGQVRNHLAPDMGWTMESEEGDGHLLLTFTRKRPEQ